MFLLLTYAVIETSHCAVHFRAHLIPLHPTDAESLSTLVNGELWVARIGWTTSPSVFSTIVVRLHLGGLHEDGLTDRYSRERSLCSSSVR